MRLPRCWQIIATMIVIVGPAYGQATDAEMAIARAAKPAVDRWTLCVLETARRWASGSDPADLIAKIAADSCPAERAAAGEAMKGTRSAVIVESLSMLDRQNRQMAAMAVLEARRR